MIKINHIDKETTTQLRNYLKNWEESLSIEYDEFEELYAVVIDDKAPVQLKYWSGVEDYNIYLHVGSKILAIRGEVDIW